MKIKNVKLVWNVIYYDINKNIITYKNIFSSNFCDELHKYLVKLKKYTYNDIKTYVDRWFAYYYMSRCEYEVIITNFSDTPRTSRKIDIYYQIQLNLDRICEYIIKEMHIEYEKTKNNN